MSVPAARLGAARGAHLGDLPRQFASPLFAGPMSVWSARHLRVARCCCGAGGGARARRPARRGLTHRPSKIPPTIPPITSPASSPRPRHVAGRRGRVDDQAAGLGRGRRRIRRAVRGRLEDIRSALAAAGPEAHGRFRAAGRVARGDRVRDALQPERRGRRRRRRSRRRRGHRLRPIASPASSARPRRSPPSAPSPPARPPVHRCLSCFVRAPRRAPSLRDATKSLCCICGASGAKMPLPGQRNGIIAAEGCAPCSAD